MACGFPLPAGGRLRLTLKLKRSVIVERLRFSARFVGMIHRADNDVGMLELKRIPFGPGTPGCWAPWRKSKDEQRWTEDWWIWPKHCRAASQIYESSNCVSNQSLEACLLYVQANMQKVCLSYTCQHQMEQESNKLTREVQARFLATTELQKRECCRWWFICVRLPQINEWAGIFIRLTHYYVAAVAPPAAWQCFELKWN